MKAAIVGGGVAETPVRAVASENILQGQKMSDELIHQAGLEVKSDLQAMSDHRASAAYRTEMARVLTERSLQRALDRLN